MLMNSKTALIEIFDAKISSIDGNFELDAKLTKVNKSELLTINNPEYDVLIGRYQHLNAVRMDDKDTKDKLTIQRYTWYKRITHGSRRAQNLSWVVLGNLWLNKRSSGGRS